MPELVSVDYAEVSYSHFLYYDDLQEALAALKYVREEFDAEAEVDEAEAHDVLTPGYAYMVTFMTDDEIGGEEAEEELFQVTLPDASDLNILEDQDEDQDDEDEIDLGDFPAVFTADARDEATQFVENAVTIEYIERLERIAETAFAYYLECEGEGDDESETAALLYEALEAVDFMKA